MELLYTITHTIGNWPVYGVEEVKAVLGVEDHLTLLKSLPIGNSTMVDTRWKSIGQAIGYLKRKAKSEPDTSSKFVVVPVMVLTPQGSETELVWEGTYIIHFMIDKNQY